MRTFIEVTGHGAVVAVPDRIDLHVSVTLVRAGVGEALEATDARVRELGTALRAAGLADEDLRTTHSSVSDEYGGPDGTRTGYRSTHDLRLRVSDADRVAEVLAAAVAAAGDDFRMNNLGWSLTDQAGLQVRAREAAFEDARAKAEELAALAGTTLGALLRVTETESHGPVPRFAVAKADAAGFAPERGTSQVDAALTVRWAIA